MSDRPDDELERRLRARFVQTCETLAPATRRELRRRREAALESARTRRPGLWRPLAPAGAMAAAFVIALAIWPTPRSGRLTPAPAISAEAAQETADDTAQALDDDPDFYLWLATEPVADDDSTSRSAAAQEGNR